MSQTLEPEPPIRRVRHAAVELDAATVLYHDAVERYLAACHWAVDQAALRKIGASQVAKLRRAELHVRQALLSDTATARALELPETPVIVAAAEVWERPG